MRALAHEPAGSGSTPTSESAMDATAAEIENGMLRSHGVRMPPDCASGTPVNTIVPWRTERSVE
jgi:hypothetical protein